MVAGVIYMGMIYTGKIYAGKNWLGTACLLVLAAAAYGQQPIASMRATMRGGGNPNGGKCTIEVNVDGVAEVEVTGDMGRMRTLSGQPSQWRRFECSGVL